MPKKKLILGENIVFVENKEEFSVSYKMDEGIQFGLGFFETILIRDRAYFLEEHIERLNQSLEQFGFNRHLSFETMEEFIESHFLKNTALKLMVTEKNAFALVRPIPYDATSYQAGKKVTISTGIRGQHTQLVAHKTLNYGENLLQMRMAKASGYDDCLFINEHGHITESSNANLFIIQGGKLKTPPLSDGLLPGIIRRKILENFDTAEDHICREEMKLCQGAFLTNSLFGVMQISKMGDVELPSHQILDEVIRFFGDMIPKK